MADAFAIVPSVTTKPCNPCGAPVVWAVTSSGKKMPLDATPTDNGNVYLTWDPEARCWRATVQTTWEAKSPAWAEVPLHVHHGTTCPRAREWWHVHEKARPARPDAPGRPSGLAPALHPSGQVRPVQEGLFA